MVVVRCSHRFGRIRPSLVLARRQIDNTHVHCLILLHFRWHRRQLIDDVIVLVRHEFALDVADVEKYRLAAAVRSDESVAALTTEVLDAPLVLRRVLGSLLYRVGAQSARGQRTRQAKLAALVESW